MNSLEQAVLVILILLKVMQSSLSVKIGLNSSLNVSQKMILSGMDKL